jgi:peptide/nickel transport system substrate-binding protein
MKRVLQMVLLAAAVALAAGLASQTRAAESKASGSDIPVLRVGLIGSVSTLDPARSVGATNNFVRFLYDSLAELGSNGAIKPRMALRIRHPSPNVWIYTLRRGIRFHDGSELTAEDVANALNYYRFPQFQTASFFRSVRNVTALDRYTVKVDLKRPDVSWKYTPAFMSYIFQKRHADANPGQWGRPGTLPIGTGPYRVVSLDPTRGAEFVAFDRYWGGRPQIRRIQVRFLADETSAAVAMRAGEIDVVFPQDARAFSSTAGQGVQVIRVPTCAIGLLSMNYNVAPWNDVHVRRAVAYAVNRRGIVNALGGSVVSEDQLVPKSMWGAAAPKAAVDRLYNSLPKYEYNLTKARAELRQSRYPNGFSATTLTTAALAQPNTAAQIIVADLAKIGIRLELRNVTVAQWVAHFFGPRSDIGLFVTGSGCATPDPSWYPGVFLDSNNARAGGTNIADYKKPAIDTLLKSGTTTENATKRLDAYGRMLRTLRADVPYVVYYRVNNSFAVSRRFQWRQPHQFSLTGRPWPIDITTR